MVMGVTLLDGGGCRDCEAFIVVRLLQKRREEEEEEGGWVRRERQTDRDGPPT